jgi:hypothetical protein
MMKTSREWNFPAVMTAKRLLMKFISIFFFNFATQKTVEVTIGLFLALKIGSATSAKGQCLI